MPVLYGLAYVIMALDFQFEANPSRSELRRRGPLKTGTPD
jgi:hypothetical protein